MKHYVLTLTLALASQIGSQAASLPYKLWYNQPARAFEESLPIGNGKLGALIYGGADKDSLYLNDITLWTGTPVNPNEGGDAYKWIPKIREALFKEDYKTADSLQHYVQGHNSEYYQPLGLLQIKDANSGKASQYYRELSLDNSIAQVSYLRNGVKYTKEYFASHPDKLIAIKLGASQKNAINCEISLTSLIPHKVKASQQQLTMTGHVTGNEENSIHYCTILQVKHTDGKVWATDSTLHLQNVSEAIAYLVNETSYNGFDKHPVKEGAPYIEKVTDDAWHLANFTYEEFKQRHITDYKSLFGRVNFKLDKAQCDTKRTTAEQLLAYTDQQERNPYLEMLYFHYGRYLLISSSRTPGVPANLQGLWASALYSPWRGNYTTNINLEENYWPAEVANLSELVAPVDGLIKGLASTGKHNAQHFYGINKGWCAGHNTDAWAMSNPVGTGNESPQWSNWALGGAWLVQTLWDHYDYTRDTDYLRNTAYPLMKGAADFLLEWLIPDPHNPAQLITAPCTSPEADYINDKGYQGSTFYGGTADLAIIRELFKNTIKGAQALGIDTEYQQQLQSALERLRPYHIGKRGNLMEWYYDWDDQDWHHRHQSHLLGLYPFHQISVDKTPELAAASTKTLEIKGDNSTGWSTGWRINLWARLHRADKAYQILRKLLTYVSPDSFNDKTHRSGGTYPNLFDAHPPFQIDGNFGGTAGICEMLMQSDGETMYLLPALPEAWKNGEITGIKARGNYEVSLRWKNGKVNKATITCQKAGNLTINYNGKQQKLSFGKGETKIVK
nr:glycoside hydrolase family 95 protein [uncultured Prevotella sp.]